MPTLQTADHITYVIGTNTAVKYIYRMDSKNPIYYSLTGLVSGNYPGVRDAPFGV